MPFLRNALVTMLLWASVCSADPVTFCPAAKICYSVGIPPSTSTQGHGAIYIQITAGSPGYSWVGIGIGSRMANSTIFVMYADGSGNVTISGRSGQGHIMPELNPLIQQDITLLSGSGVFHDRMTANFKYLVSSLDGLRFDSASTNWISAWRTGDPLDSAITSAPIAQHDVGSDPTYQQFSLDLTEASTFADSSPFTSTGSTDGSLNPTPSTSSAVVVTTVNESPKYMKAHGIIMACSMVVLFPLGALFMRVFGGVWFHAAIQIFTLCAVIAGFALGVHVAQLQDLLFNNTHSILGTVVVCLFLLQPFLGLVHHWQYRKVGRRTYFSYAHIWYGRTLIILAIINGGLGLQFANNANNYEIAYGAVAGTIFLAYVAIIAITGMRKERSIKSVSNTHY